MKLVYLVPFLLFLSSCSHLNKSSRGLAQNTERTHSDILDVPFEKTDHRYLIEFPDDEFLEFKTFIQQTIKSINGNLKKFKPAELKTIKLYKVGDYAAFTPSDQSLIYPSQFEFETPDGESVKRSIVEYGDGLVIHEYAHALFESNMLESIPSWKNYRQLMNQFVPLQKERRRLNNDFEFGLFTKAKNPKEYRRLQILNKAVDELDAKLKAEPFDVFKDEYDELFADVVAVFSLNDPSAISKLIKFKMADKEFTAVFESRDFDIRISSKGWTEADAHAYFRPTRYYLWRIYNKKKPDLNEFLHVVYESIVAEIKARSADKSLQSISPEKANKRLMLAISKRLKEL